MAVAVIGLRSICRCIQPVEPGRGFPLVEERFVPVRRFSLPDRFPAALSTPLTRRAALASGAAGALGAIPVLAQDAPPIEPIGSEVEEAPEAPVVIEPDATQAPDEIPLGESVGGTVAGEEMYFAATGHNLGLPFYETWLNGGGFDVFGAPLSEARYIADVIETHQTFETLTMTYDPDLPLESRIQGLPLGTTLVNRWSSADARKKLASAPAGERFFQETGHSLAEPFLSFWNAHGGINLFGMPVTEPFRSDAGTTQVFEKAVMDQAADGAVMLRRIGRQWVQENRLEGHEAFVPAPPNNGKTSLVSSAEGLRLRGGPSLDAEVRVILPDNAEFIAVENAGGEWVPGYVDGYSGWVSSAFLVEPRAIPEIAATDWNLAVWQGAALGETNVRAEPNTTSETVRTIPSGTSVTVVDWVRGEEVVENSFIWAVLDDGTYIYARNVGRNAPVAPPPVPDEYPWEGKWIDVHLTQQLMVAYEGRTPVRTVVVTTGMPDWETPTGWYTISNRVENETMTSGAIGAEYFYKLEDVLYTQYFTDRGHALHYAWWRTPETIGRPGSHGCLNLLLEDAEFFWNWADYGTAVIVRNV
jgi:hypothetical protein